MDVGAEEALRQSREELQAIYDGMVDGIQIADAETRRILRANPAMCRMLGYTERELLGKCVPDLHPPERLAEVLAAFSSLAEGKSSFVPNLPFLRKDGTVLFADVGARRIAFEGRCGVIGFFRDSTPRMQAEEVLRNSEANVWAILNASTESTLLIDTEGRILAANDELARRFGRRLGELMGACVYDLLPPDVAETRAARAAQAIRSGQPLRFEDERFGRTIDSQIYPILDGSGQVTRLAVFGRDITEEKRQHDALRKSEERFRAMAAATPIPIVISRESDGVILYGNDLLGELFGAPSAALLGRRTLEFYADPEDRTRVRKVLRKQGRLENYAVRARKADGTPFWVVVSIHRMTYEGHPALIAGFYDVDERKRLEETRRRQALVLESIYDAVLVTDLDNRIVDWNMGAERLFGYAKAEILGRGPEVLDRPEDAAALTRQVQEKLRAGQRWADEIRFVHKDGTEGFCDTVVVPLRDPEGIHLGSVSVARDTTLRKQAEQALGESEAKFRALVEHMPQRIFVKDRHSVYVTCNRNYARDLGIEAEAIAGRTDLEFYPQALAEKYRTDDQQIVTSGTIKTYEEPYVSLGQEGWVRTTKVPYRDGNGNIMGVFGIFEDITEQKRAEERARTRQAELEHFARLSTMGEMAVELSHELNQPLVAITNYAKGAIRRIQSGTVAPGELVEPLEKIAVQAGRAGQVIRRTWGFVRRREPHRSPVEINELVKEVIELVNYEARARAVQVTLELSPALSPVLADRIQIQQVVLNLVRNALEATRETDRPDRTVRLHTTTTEDGGVEVAVRDDGPGIPPELADRIFEPFFTTRPEGMGMGLTICRSIVTDHGGRLWASPNPDRGTTFRFTLPGRAPTHPTQSGGES
jgi:two-component system sensor kinase FixL